MNALETLNTFAEMGESIDATIMQNRDNALTDDTPNSKYERSYNQKETGIAINHGSGLPSRRITALCKMHGVMDVDQKKWENIVFSDIHKLRKALGHHDFHPRFHKMEKSEDGKKRVQVDVKNPPLGHVFAVTNLKGGVAKSTSTVTIATGLVSELSNSYKVLLFDADMQGTTTNNIKPNFSDKDVSLGDILMGTSGVDINEPGGFDEAIERFAYKTNFENLDIICAKEDDMQYSTLVEKRSFEASKAGTPLKNPYQAFMDLIAAARKKYDVILIDTSPRIEAATTASLLSATSLIVPVSPSENDRDSTQKYLGNMKEMYQTVVALGHEGYESIDILLTNVRNGSAAHLGIEHSLRLALNGQNIFNSAFYQSDAVNNCQEDYCTIYDQSPSEFKGSKGSLEKAQENTTKVIREFERKMIEIWTKEIKRNETTTN